MEEIDARSWGDDVKRALANAALSGGAVINVGDNLQVVVLDLRLWESLEQQLPTFSEVVKNIRDLGPKD